jgi:hypothetical protein
MAPDLTLHFSPGDTAALPSLVTASACGVTLKHSALDKASTALLSSSAPFGDASSVLLTGPNGLALYEPIAIARYIASQGEGETFQTWPCNFSIFDHLLLCVSPFLGLNISTAVD